MTLLERGQAETWLPSRWIQHAAPSAVVLEVATAFLPGLLAGAATVHLGMVPLHAGVSELEGMAFAATGWLQASAAIGLNRASPQRWALQAAAALNALVVTVWAASRMVGLMVGSDPEIGGAGMLVAVLELAVIAICAMLLRWPRAAGRADSLGRPLVHPALPTVLLIGLAAYALTQSADHAHTVGADPSQSLAAHGHPGSEAGGVGASCLTLRAELDHHWSADDADELTSLGCNDAATAATAGSGDPRLDEAPFTDRLYSDVATAIADTRLAVCSVPNLNGVLGATEGLVFHLAQTWEDCDDRAAPRGEIAVAAYPSRLARDKAATSADGAGKRWVYGRFVVAALDGTHPTIAKAVTKPIASLDVALAVSR